MSLEPEGPQPDYEQFESPPAVVRTTLPGIFLIIVAVLNLLLGCGAGFVAFMFSQIPHADLVKVFNDLPADQRDALKQIDITGPEDLRNMYVRGGTVLGVAWGLAALPALLGGSLMCARRARGLAIFGAILAALPLISPSACPCIFGMAIGIWALVVLFSADGKAAFRPRNF